MPHGHGITGHAGGAARTAGGAATGSPFLP